MLEDVLFFTRPYRHFLCFETLDEAVLAEAKAVLRGPLPWETRVGSFYVTYRLDLRAHLRGNDGPRFVHEDFLFTMRDRMAEIFSTPLSDDIQVLGHKMVPDQTVGVHNDNPGLGYESYRIVTQFTEDHRPEDGGTLNIYASPRSEDVYQSIRPCLNMSFGFEMSGHSYHSVSKVNNRQRDALIFNFWHVGNAPAVERLVHKALDALPAEGGLERLLGPCAKEELVPEIFHAPAACARLLQVWSIGDHAAAAGFLMTLREGSRDARPDEDHPLIQRLRRAAGLPLDMSAFADPSSLAEASAAGQDPASFNAAIALAIWLARARKRMFSPELWEAAYRKVAPCRDRLPEEPRRIAGTLFPEHRYAPKLAEPDRPRSAR